jgi:hypothetical protein
VGRGPKGYQRDDNRIREDVSEELTNHPEIDASEIEVRVSNGEVTLTGTVHDRQAKRAAEDLIENCPGVKEVHNQLRVSPTSGAQGGSTTGSMSGGTTGSAGTGGESQSGSEGRTARSTARSGATTS